MEIRAQEQKRKEQEAEEKRALKFKKDQEKSQQRAAAAAAAAAKNDKDSKGENNNGNDNNNINSSSNDILGANAAGASSGMAAIHAAGVIKRKAAGMRRGGNVDDGKSHMWDDTPHDYSFAKVKREEHVKIGSSESRHAFRRNCVFPPPGRCGHCTGCAALTRCENKGAYNRIDEAIDIISSGLLHRDDKESFQDALEILRKGKADVTQKSRQMVERKMSMRKSFRKGSRRKSTISSLNI